MNIIRNTIKILIILTLLIPWIIIFISGLNIQGKTNSEFFGLVLAVEYFFPFIIGIYVSNKFGKWFDSKLKQDEEES